MVTTKPVVAGDQIVSSDSLLRRSLIGFCRCSGIHMENLQIQSSFDDMVTLTYLVCQEVGKVTLET
jgi:hypothetical protein